jgi:hypothetical protein
MHSFFYGGAREISCVKVIVFKDKWMSWIRRCGFRISAINSGHQVTAIFLFWRSNHEKASALKNVPIKTIGDSDLRIDQRF